MTDAREQSWIVDLVTIEMKDRQHSAVPIGIEKLVDVPRSGQRTRFRLAITNDRSHDQVGIVESRAASMGQDIPQFSALMNRPRRFRSAMAADAAGK